MKTLKSPSTIPTMMRMAFILGCSIMSTMTIMTIIGGVTSAFVPMPALQRRQYAGLTADTDADAGIGIGIGTGTGTGIGTIKFKQNNNTRRVMKKQRRIMSRYISSNNNNNNGNQDDEKENGSRPEKLPTWWLPSSSSSSSPSSSKQKNQSYESPTRKKRLLRIHQDLQRFAHAGSELQELRSDIQVLQSNLKLALVIDDIPRIISLSTAIEKSQQRDPEFVYGQLLEKLRDVQQMNVSKKYQLLPKIMEEAIAVRQYVPRLNMEGLWIGNFGTNFGSGLVNVTYTGDTLVATKVTGECPTPKGEVLFRANLFPTSSNSEEQGKTTTLDPIPLTGSAATKWGVEQLERYPGEGQVPAAEKGDDMKFVDGQLIMFDGYFSFLFVPSRKHVFFSRPSAELVLHLMESVITVEADYKDSDFDESEETAREHLDKCFKKDIDTPIATGGGGGARDRRSSPKHFLARNEYCSKEELLNNFEYQNWLPSASSSSSKVDTKSSFWTFHKWMNYIDAKLKPKANDD